MAVSLVPVIPFFSDLFLLFLSPQIYSLLWFVQIILPVPVFAGFFGYLFAPRLLSVASDRSCIAGANVGVRVTFIAWVAYGICISIPIPIYLNPYLCCDKKFFLIVMYFVANFFISVLTAPLICLVGAITGAGYVAVVRGRDNNASEGTASPGRNPST